MVKVLEEQGHHGLKTGDFFTFSCIKGLDGALNEPSNE